MRSAAGRVKRSSAGPPVFVGDLYQQRYVPAPGDRLGPARQPELGASPKIAIDCDAAADVGAGSRPRLPPPCQGSLADALSHGLGQLDRAATCPSARGPQPLRPSALGANQASTRSEAKRAFPVRSQKAERRHSTFRALGTTRSAPVGMERHAGPATQRCGI